MSKQFVQDLKDGEVVASDFQINDIQEGTTKNGKSFKRFKLSDKTGDLPGVYWDSVSCPHIYKSGDICRVHGSVNLYQGRPQITVSGVGPKYTDDPSMFEKVTKYDIQVLWHKMVEFIGTLQDQEIRRIAEEIFLGSGFDEAFRTMPAATGMHHAFRGGLIEHTVEMCECADALLKLPFFQPLNRDLCLFGVMFHDFGKIFEYSSQPGFKKTAQGVLVPHIPMMAAIIYEACNRYSVAEVIRDHLMHVVLAHHGRMEWGSPVDMAFPEAAFVHYVDNLHGTVFGWLQKIESQKGSELIDHWGNKKFSLIGTPFNEILKTVRVNTADAVIP